MDPERNNYIFLRFKFIAQNQLSIFHSHELENKYLNTLSSSGHTNINHRSQKSTYKKPSSTGHTLVIAEEIQNVRRKDLDKKFYAHRYRNKKILQLAKNANNDAHTIPLNELFCCSDTHCISYDQRAINVSPLSMV